MTTSKPTEVQSSPGWGGQPKPGCNSYTYTLWFLRDVPSAQPRPAHDFRHIGPDCHIGTCRPLLLFML